MLVYRRPWFRTVQHKDLDYNRFGSCVRAVATIASIVVSRNGRAVINIRSGVTQSGMFDTWPAVLTITSYYAHWLLAHGTSGADVAGILQKSMSETKMRMLQVYV